MKKFLFPANCKIYAQRTQNINRFKKNLNVEDIRANFFDFVLNLILIYLLFLLTKL